MKVYLVVFEWTTEDCSEVEIYPYSTYAKAVNHYKEIIKAEKQPDMWASDAFNKYGKFYNKSYELDELKPDLEKETECYWDLTCRHNWYLKDYLRIEIKEIK